jgi:hypothetical protein
MANPSAEDTVTTQARTPILTPADQTLSFPFLPRLPSEIRQLIWFFTFSPRVIQIQLHSQASPKNPTKSTSIMFTATEDLIAIRPSYVRIESISSTDANPATFGLVRRLFLALP